jgi:plasmid stability protein
MPRVAFLPRGSMAGRGGRTTHGGSATDPAANASSAGRSQNGAIMDLMPVTLSVKNVPNDVARRLKARAARNHRSLQGELRSILEEAARATTVVELVALARRLGLKGPAGESAAMVREDRDGRDR